MPTHDVKLPIGQRPLFPPRCVVCECDRPTTTAKVRILGATRTQSWAEDVVDLSVGSTVHTGGVKTLTLHPPACRRCAKNLSRWHLWLIAAKYGGAMLGVGLMIVLLLKGWTYLAIAAVLLGVILPVVYELWRPPAFNATVQERQIIYEFLSPTYAQEFSQLNQPDPTPTQPD